MHLNTTYNPYARDPGFNPASLLDEEFDSLHNPGFAFSDRSIARTIIVD